jgi:hypothetical protein
MIFNMKRIKYLAILALLGLSSCTQEFNYDPIQEIQENAENIFGIIDPNQDWRTTTSGTVTITANADLDDIAKVQILTESPFFNDQAKILAEADVAAGQTVTLSYDAPRSNSRLIAACVDSNGRYFIRGFNIGDETVSFSSSTSALTRGFGMTRAVADLPNLSLDFNKSFLSYNATRTLNNSTSWRDKNWENDRLWQTTGPESYNGWTISNSTIYRDATALTEDEAATLKDIFDASLSRYDGGKPRNNLQFINESSIVQLYGNHLESTGKAAITLCPVQIASTEAYWCDIYYYYYRTEDIPGGTSEADYIKTLPKFKAIDVNDERQAFSAVTGIALTAKDDHFIRLHEYLLPFYGNASEFKLMPSSLSTYGYTTNGKFYRIYNYSGNSGKNIPAANHYVTYNENHDLNLQDAYTDDIEYQLWQIFTSPDGTILLYNIGSKKFLWWDNGNYIESKDIAEKSFKNYSFNITDGDRNPIDLNNITNQKVYIYSNNLGNCIKVLLDKGRRLMFSGGKQKNDSREFTFEEYSYTSATAINDFELSLDYFPAGRIAPPSTTPSAIIPEGYRIGFMIRKNGGEETEKVYLDKQGCLYGYGELNTEINTYGQFKSAVSNYGMELNSPRMATFTANNKIYLCFEEGADTQYSDVIVELGSTGETGIYMFDDVQEVENMPYTMCFEDRPQVADYDMNDVVLHCVRKSATQLELSLIATGAQDRVNIEGIDGACISGTDLNYKEVHELFDVSYGTFVNTQLADEVKNPVTAIYKVDESTTIPQFLSKIYIRNVSQGGNEIRVPKKGEPPFALIVPGDFDYPIERVSIINAYEAFRTWANNAYNYGEWLDSSDDSKIYPNHPRW